MSQDPEKIQQNNNAPDPSLAARPMPPIVGPSEYIPLPNGQPSYGQPGIYPPANNYPGQPPVGMPPYPGYPPTGMPPYPGYPPTGMPPYPGYPPTGMPPYPGYPPAPKKSKAWLWVLLSVLGVGLVLCGISCPLFSSSIAGFSQQISQSVRATETARAINNGNTGSTPTTTNALGDEVAVKNVVCTAISAKSVAIGSSTPNSADKNLLIVRVQIKNNGTEPVEYNPSDFTVTNDVGHLLRYTALVSESDQKLLLNYGTLKAGQTITGNVAYDLSPTDQGLILNWEPSFMLSSDAPVEWDLNL